MLAKPNEEHRASDQRDDHAGAKEEARVRRDVRHRFEANGDAVALVDREKQGAEADQVAKSLPTRGTGTP